MLHDIRGEWGALEVSPGYGQAWTRAVDSLHQASSSSYISFKLSASTTDSLSPVVRHLLDESLALLPLSISLIQQ